MECPAIPRSNRLRCPGDPRGSRLAIEVATDVDPTPAPARWTRTAPRAQLKRRLLEPTRLFVLQDLICAEPPRRIAHPDVELSKLLALGWVEEDWAW